MITERDEERLGGREGGPDALETLPFREGLSVVAKSVIAVVDCRAGTGLRLIGNAAETC